VIFPYLFSLNVSSSPLPSTSSSSSQYLSLPAIKHGIYRVLSIILNEAQYLSQFPGIGITLHLSGWFAQRRFPVSNPFDKSLASSSVHSPLWITSTSANLAKHSFEYVLPLEPHTGSYISGQIIF